MHCISVSLVIILFAWVGSTKASTPVQQGISGGGTGSTSASTSGGSPGTGSTTGGVPSTLETFPIGPLGQITFYLCGNKSQSGLGTSGIGGFNSLTVTYDIGSTWVTIPNTVQVWADSYVPLQAPGTITATAGVAWGAYAQIYSPAGNTDGSGNIFTSVTVTYQVDDVAYASAYAFSQMIFGSAYGISSSDDLMGAVAQETGLNATSDFYDEDEIPYYTTYTNTATYELNELVPVASKPNYYYLPYTQVFSSSISTKAVWTFAQQQGSSSNDASAIANVFFDTSGATKVGLNAVSFGFQ